MKLHVAADSDIDTFNVFMCYCLWMVFDKIPNKLKMLTLTVNTGLLKCSSMAVENLLSQFYLKVKDL